MKIQKCLSMPKLLGDWLTSHCKEFRLHQNEVIAGLLLDYKRTIEGGDNAVNELDRVSSGVYKMLSLSNGKTSDAFVRNGVSPEQIAIIANGLGRSIPDITEFIINNQDSIQIELQRRDREESRNIVTRMERASA
jgi:hypothetical protein